MMHLLLLAAALVGVTSACGSSGASHPSVDKQLVAADAGLRTAVADWANALSRCPTATVVACMAKPGLQYEAAIAHASAAYGAVVKANQPGPCNDDMVSYGRALQRLNNSLAASILAKTSTSYAEGATAVVSAAKAMATALSRASRACAP
jgi:hypothetical protein